MKKVLFLVAMFFSIALTTQAATEVTADCGSQVTISATPKEGYHFLRWNDNNTDNPRIVDVTGNATYTAFFAPNKYMITFENWNGAELYKAEFDYGTTPVYGGATPTKPADAQYTYTFDSWSPNIHAVTGVETYTALFATTVNQYTVTFKNWDGSVLQSTSVAYGEMPNYTGTTPTKPATDQYTYTFKGWDEKLTNIKQDLEVYPLFEEITFEVTFLDIYSNVIEVQKVKQGEAAVAPEAPTMDYYSFTGWDKKFNNITQNLTVRATYQKQSNNYATTSKDYWLYQLSNKYDIRKELMSVQEIASLLGETAAETKIALTKLKESIADE